MSNAIQNRSKQRKEEKVKETKQRYNIQFLREDLKQINEQTNNQFTVIKDSVKNIEQAMESIKDNMEKVIEINMQLLDIIENFMVSESVEGNININIVTNNCRY